ncbi:recombinase family protein [Catenulispora sp. NL8]|uniref:Recombinase family protein n=1 Tax=Catenulispora pinistramenti TaxID=2705254 RepID=A0ABS5KGS8_9ACTN|nr:recombinase family protein [Catenulispora pinistramenti]
MVIYLWAPDEDTAAAAFAELSARCERYAYRFCWDIVEIIRDVGGSNEYFDHRAQVNACGRTGLDQVLTLLKEKRATIVLVPDLRMVGSTALIYTVIREHLEEHGGFLQVVSGAAQGTGLSSIGRIPSVTSENANDAPELAPADEAERTLPTAAKARILALVETADLSDGFGALLHMAAVLGSDSKTLVPKTEEERFAWAGHMDGLHAALMCLARHEQQQAPEVAAQIVDSLMGQAEAILQESAAGREG